MKQVLILAPEEDVHARSVAKQIELLGACATIADLGHSSKVSHRLQSEDARIDEIVIGTCALHLEEVSSVWNRRPRMPPIPETLTFDADRHFATAEWAAMLDGIMLAPFPKRCVNDLRAQRTASKPQQIQVAKMAGLAIPETLITSDASRAAAFVQEFDGDVIHKTLTAPREGFLATKRWSESDREALGQLELAPTIFQEQVKGEVDLRITAIGDKLFAAAFPTTTLCNGKDTWIDNRLNLDVPYTEHALPEQVQGGLLATMRQLGLVFGTIDMKIDEAGRYVFLEINPQGQFVYIEILTGMPLSKALAEYLLLDA